MITVVSKRDFLFLSFLPLLKNFFFIAIELIYNAVLVSDVQQSESVTHIHIATLCKILLPFRSLQSTE